MEVHGEIWTVKSLFVFPNEYVYWSLQIVMYPFLTGLVAGTFVISSLYYVFDVKELRDLARFSLVLSFAFLCVAMTPLLLHLHQPFKGPEVMLTPHYTSAIAAFGIVFPTYFAIVASEIWFVYRKHIVDTALSLRNKIKRTFVENFRYLVFTVLTLGSYDVSERALRQDERIVKVLAGVGFPTACFLTGYAGFIFGSVKANALWMTPLMPVIFIMSALVSGTALCMLTYIIVMEIRKMRITAKRTPSQFPFTREEIKGVELRAVRITSRYLLFFLILAISLELLDLVFRGYTDIRSWDILRSVIYEKDFREIFVLQYGIGNLIPFILILAPGLNVRRAFVICCLVLFGVFMMRWNVVIGGQEFSLSFMGYMHYKLPIWPHDVETFKEGVFGATLVFLTPFVIFYVLNKIFPVLWFKGGIDAKN
jgi:Ni/Fe-hydrogenase subunit HybB-like protein